MKRTATRYIILSLLLVSCLSLAGCKVVSFLLGSWGDDMDPVLKAQKEAEDHRWGGEITK